MADISGFQIFHTEQKPRETDWNFDLTDSVSGIEKLGVQKYMQQSFPYWSSGLMSAGRRSLQTTL